MLHAGATAAWGGAPPGTEASPQVSPQVTEHVDTVLRQKVYVLEPIPRQCTGKGTDEYSCWEIYPTAWEALDLSHKGIRLTIHLWVNDGPPPFKDCDLETLIDGETTTIKDVHFQPGSHFFEGATATLDDYELVRMLALANDAAVAADVKPSVQIALTSETLKAIYAIYNKYNSLEAPGSRIEQLNAKLNDLVKQMRDANDQFPQGSLQDCKTVACLDKTRSALTSMLSLSQSFGLVLDEKIAYLIANPQGVGAEQEKNRAIESRTELNEAIQNAKVSLDDVNKKLASAR